MFQLPWYESVTNEYFLRKLDWTCFDRSIQQLCQRIMLAAQSWTECKSVHLVATCAVKVHFTMQFPIFPEVLAGVQYRRACNSPPPVIRLFQPLSIFFLFYIIFIRLHLVMNLFPSPSSTFSFISFFLFFFSISTGIIFN